MQLKEIDKFINDFIKDRISQSEDNCLKITHQNKTYQLSAVKQLLYNYTETDAAGNISRLSGLKLKNRKLAEFKSVILMKLLGQTATKQRNKHPDSLIDDKAFLLVEQPKGEFKDIYKLLVGECKILRKLNTVANLAVMFRPQTKKIPNEQDGAAAKTTIFKPLEYLILERLNLINDGQVSLKYYKSLSKLAKSLQHLPDIKNISVSSKNTDVNQIFETDSRFKSISRSLTPKQRYAATKAKRFINQQPKATQSTSNIVTESNRINFKGKTNLEDIQLPKLNKYHADTKEELLEVLDLVLDETLLEIRNHVNFNKKPLDTKAQQRISNYISSKQLDYIGKKISIAEGLIEAMPDKENHNLLDIGITQERDYETNTTAKIRMRLLRSIVKANQVLAHTGNLAKPVSEYAGNSKCKNPTLKALEELSLILKQPTPIYFTSIESEKLPEFKDFTKVLFPKAKSQKILKILDVKGFSDLHRVDKLVNNSKLMNSLNLNRIKSKNDNLIKHLLTIKNIVIDQNEVELKQLYEKDFKDTTLWHNFDQKIFKTLKVLDINSLSELNKLTVDLEKYLEKNLASQGCKNTLKDLKQAVYVLSLLPSNPYKHQNTSKNSDQEMFKSFELAINKAMQDYAKQHPELALNLNAKEYITKLNRFYLNRDLGVPIDVVPDSIATSGRLFNSFIQRHPQDCNKNSFNLSAIGQSYHGVRSTIWRELCKTIEIL